MCVDCLICDCYVTVLYVTVLYSLMPEKADMTAREDGGGTPLHIAAPGKNLKALKDFSLKAKARMWH